MQNTLYQWFLCACLLFLPMGLNANIAAPKSKIAAATIAIWTAERRHFPTANPLDRFKILEKWQHSPKKGQKIGKNRVFTEGASDADKERRAARRKRIFAIIAAVIVGVALVYFLQGSIWLSVVGLGIFGYFRNRNKIAEWERRRYERQQADNVAADSMEETDDEGNLIKRKLPLSHPSNKWTRRAVNRFVVGLVAPNVGVIFILLGFLGGDVLGVLGGLMVVLGLGFLIVSMVNAFQAIKDKEPRRGYAKAIIVIGLLVLLPYLLSLVAG